MSELKIIETRLKDHVESDKKVFANIASTIKSLNTKVDMLRDNHLAHLREDLSAVKNDVVKLKSDMGWIKGIGGVIILETLGVFIKLMFG
jgi:agmatine/peptidylarginine deiminase